MPLARQPLHRRSVHPGPLVLGTAPVKLPTPTADRDPAVSRRSEPSSRAALMGEQPNPWDLSLPPLLVGQDYTFTMAISCHHERFRCEPCDRRPIDAPISPGSKEVLPRISRYGRRIPGSLLRNSDAVLSIGHSEQPMHLPIQPVVADRQQSRSCVPGCATRDQPGAL